MNEDKDLEKTTSDLSGIHVTTGTDTVTGMNDYTWTVSGSSGTSQQIYTTQGGATWSSPVQHEALETIIGTIFRYMSRFTRIDRRG